MLRPRRRKIVHDPSPTPHQELLASIYLYVNWQYVTRQLTTEQKDLWADAVDANRAFWGSSDGEDYGKAPRWWRDDYQEDE